MTMSLSHETPGASDDSLSPRAQRMAAPQRRTAFVCGYCADVRLFGARCVMCRVPYCRGCRNSMGTMHRHSTGAQYVCTECRSLLAFTESLNMATFGCPLGRCIYCPRLAVAGRPLAFCTHCSHVAYRCADCTGDAQCIGCVVVASDR